MDPSCSLGVWGLLVGVPVGGTPVRRGKVSAHAQTRWLHASHQRTYALTSLVDPIKVVGRRYQGTARGRKPRPDERLPNGSVDLGRSIGRLSGGWWRATGMRGLRCVDDERPGRSFVGRLRSAKTRRGITSTDEPTRGHERKQRGPHSTQPKAPTPWRASTPYQDTPRSGPDVPSNLGAARRGEVSAHAQSLGSAGPQPLWGPPSPSARRYAGARRVTTLFEHGRKPRLVEQASPRPAHQREGPTPRANNSGPCRAPATKKKGAQAKPAPLPVSSKAEPPYFWRSLYFSMSSFWMFDGTSPYLANSIVYSALPCVDERSSVE